MTVRRVEPIRIARYASVPIGSVTFELSNSPPIAAGCSPGGATSGGQPLCDLAEARVETFVAGPTSALPGDPISLRVALLVDRLDSTCGLFTLPVTFDDLPLGNVTLTLTAPVAMQAGGGVSPASILQGDGRRIIRDAALEGILETVVPPQATVGDHMIRLWVGVPLETIAVTTLEVLARQNPVDTSSFPEPHPESAPSPAEPSDRLVPTIAVVVTGGLSILAAAGAGGLLLAKRRRYAEPCTGERKTWMSAERIAEAARSEAEAAARRAETAEARASDAEAALAACQEELRRAGLAPIGLLLPGDDADSQVPVSEGFYLEDHPNPYATDREQLRGWFSLQRSGEVRGVVVHTGGIVPPTISTAAEATRELATIRQPLSLHAIIDDTGVVALLRDERAGRHLATADEESLGVLWLPGKDERRSLAILGSWCAAKATAHSFALRRVGFEEWIQGDSGLVAAHDFPEAAGSGHRELRWDELLETIRGKGGVALAAPVSAAGGGGDCSFQQQEFTEAQAKAQEARAAAAEAEAKAEQAEAEARAAKDQLDECECRHPVITIPINPVTQQQPDESDPSQWFLLAHQNEHGGQRANGRNGWYYASRQQPITGIVVHTAEANSGSGVATYLSKVRRPVSAHVVIDAAGPVDLLPDSVVAFHAKGGNGRGLGLEIAYTASKWGKDPEREALLYRNAAAWCALKTLQYGIPVQRVSAQQWHSGASGFISHAELDPSRRTDPGKGFQWDYFFKLIKSYIAGE